MTDIKETKEALIAIIDLVTEAKQLSADGVELSDAVALGSKFVSDSAFRHKIVAGIGGASAIIDELKDLQGAEVVELLGAAYAEIKAE